jgi:hypothetical protein
MSNYLLPAALVIGAVLVVAWQEYASGNSRDAALMASLAACGGVAGGVVAMV